MIPAAAPQYLRSHPDPGRDGGGDALHEHIEKVPDVALLQYVGWMGTHEHIRTARHWYPEGHGPPSSTLPGIIGAVLVSLGAVAVLLLLLSSFTDLPTGGLLPIVIGPLLGAALGSLIRRRTLSSKASNGLYFLQVRPVDEAGRRLGWWRIRAHDPRGHDHQWQR